MPAPKTVAPAYRLHTAVPGGSPAEASAPAVDSSRPKLVLLRPTDDAAAADVDDGDGCHYERVGVLDPPEPVCLPEVGVDLRAFRREQARRRCTMLLRCLGGVAISTGLIGVFPGMHLAWVFTGLCGRGRPRAGRADGLRQGARGRAAPPPGPRSRSGAARTAESVRSTRPRRATRVPGTTTTSRSPEPQPAERRRADRRQRRCRSGTSGRPTILVGAGGVAQLVERYVRNVEAEGSSPFTSTKSPGQRAKVGSPRRSSLSSA